MAIPDELREIAEQVDETGEPHRESVRTILSWFDQQRRGRHVSSRIRSALRELELTTFPEFETAYIGGTVEIRPVQPAPGDGDGEADGSDASEVEEDQTRVHSDPVARIRMLEAANRAPTAVNRDATVADAVTEMLLNDFSQLPVMSGDRNVSGMISWRSIGRAIAVNGPCQNVRDCMEKVEIIEADLPLLNAIGSIVRNEVVLVEETDGRISGLVTTSDVSLQFQELAEPFLLVGEIENHLRRLIDGRFELDELREGTDPGDEDRGIEGVEDLTFGEYVRLLESDNYWDRLGLDLDRVRVTKRLHRVREIRNDVMHFSPDGISSEDLDLLRDTVEFMQRL